MRNTIAATVLFLLTTCMSVLAISTPAMSETPTLDRLLKTRQIGDELMILGFCLSEEAIQVLIDAVASEGQWGYVAVMMDPDVECFDVRMVSLDRLIRVTILEKLSVMGTPSGQRLQVWRVVDNKGMTGLTWTLIEGIEV